MENSFFYWGPLLFKTKIDNYKKILNKVKKEYSYNKNLASHLDETFIFNPNEFKKNIDKAFNDYLNFYETYYNTTLSNKKYDVTASWVNFMKAGDFNPPHTHGDDFSCVLYLKIPDLLKKEKLVVKGRNTFYKIFVPFFDKTLYAQHRPSNNQIKLCHIVYELKIPSLLYMLEEVSS